ncbi:MAG: hypothetical protein H8E73_04035 [Planctomycetes bacterium]|nr:hypothetical protein [Planctomycetota bacterium]MBL7185833.1 hypothetical protein [Phycisphaerae bacterium]
MDRAKIKRIADTLTDDEKSIIQVLGEYEDKDKTGLGMQAGELEREAGFKVGQPRQVLKSLWEKEFVDRYRETDRLISRDHGWIFDFNLEEGTPLTNYLTNQRYKLADKARGFYKRPPLSKKPVKPEQEQLYVELNLAERTLTIGTDINRITSENEWDFLKTLASNTKIGCITPRMDGSKNRKNAVDTLRRNIGKDSLHQVISFSNDGYFLDPSVKLSGGSQIGIRTTRQAPK